FPSSHVAIALTTVWFSFRYLPRIRYLHLVIAMLLCLSTVYCRYHYVIDVFAGMATAAFLVPIANWLYRKTEPPGTDSSAGGPAVEKFQAEAARAGSFGER
ncbi:MAG: phosphatase PAP2 family protein, partial [Chloroflexi bacterium]